MAKKQKNSNTKEFVGMNLFPWQADVHNGLVRSGLRSGTIHIMKSKRQVGKTMQIIAELLYFSLNYTLLTSCVLSPTLAQARKIYKEILDGVQDSGIIKRKNDVMLEIEFVTGSRIFFKSAEQRDSLRGFTVSGLLCIDEAAYIADDIFSIILPVTDVYQAPILICSTPKFRAGFFYQYYNYGFLEQYKGKIFSYDICKYDTSALLSKDALERYRQTLPKNQFITEYLGEFLDSDSVVFGDFKKCITDKITSIEDSKEIYIGIDWATGVAKDDTAIVGINENGEEVLCEHFNNKTFAEQLDYIVQLLNQLKGKVKKCLSEYNSIGSPMTQNLRDRLPWLTIEQLYQTKDTKIDLVNRMQIAFEQNKIALMNIDKQTAELSMYEAKYNQKTGNVSYNACIGGNDDICIALMLAYKLYAQQQRSGQYCIGFFNNGKIEEIGNEY